MRIAQVATRYPPGPGGVERHVEELSGRLAARGHSIDILTSELYREFPWERLPRSVPREETMPYGRIHRLNVWSMPGELHYTFFRGLGRRLAELRPDVVHVHTFGTHQVAVAGRFRRRSGTPFVLTAHFHPIWSIEGGWLRHRIRGFYDRWLAGPALRDAGRIVVQTKEEERLLRSLAVPMPPVEIVPPGYAPLPSPAEGAASFARTYGLNGPFVLFVGRLASNKGLLELVDAFGDLARDAPSALLVLAGADGGMAERVDARARERGLSGRIRRIGFVDDPRLLASGYREARMLVLPSEYEAFGLVLLEALAQGTPVVASRVGGIPEVVDDGGAGLLVPPKDPRALAEAIRRLWNDPALARRLGETGRASVVPRYSWERVAERLEGIYREVTGA